MCSSSLLGRLHGKDREVPCGRNKTEEGCGQKRCQSGVTNCVTETRTHCDCAKILARFLFVSLFVLVVVVVVALMMEVEIELIA